MIMKPDEIMILCPLPERSVYKDEMAISYCVGRCKHYTSCEPAQKVEKKLAQKK
jgi:hypothetical protein